jgi:hypothetical protein
MESIEKTKDKLLPGAFSWILHTTQYATFTNWSSDESVLPPCRLLWIKGPAGTGKTMLLIGLIRKLMNQPAALAPKVSHFFCQGTGNARNNATTVLRSLLWLLLIQQPHLIWHLQAKHQYASRSLFTDSTTFLALSDAFQSMLTDPQFLPTYLIVDALDECDQGLEDLVQLISTSLSICGKVKWLVASRPEVELNSPDIRGSLLELDAQKFKGSSQCIHRPQALHP